MPWQQLDYSSLRPFCTTPRQLEIIEAASVAPTIEIAAARVDITPRAMYHTIQRIKASASEKGWTDGRHHPDPVFEAEALPSSTPPLDELLERRRKVFQRKRDAKHARNLIDVKVNVEGPFGICFLGDPHVDDDGCDIEAVEHHIQVLDSNRYLFAGNIGDTTNNWVGRLARLYSEQSTTASEAWVLAEWFIGAFEWLFIVGGNHDVWSGAGDPLKWMSRGSWGVHEDHGCRLALTCPNGREIRVNARHDFHGHSMWNPAHGPMKAAQMGWRDHILACGHKHITGQGILKDPATGLISHAIRVATFKVVDRYADQLNLPDGNVSPSCSVIIDPDMPDNHPGCVTVIHDVERASEFLSFLRERRGLAAA